MVVAQAKFLRSQLLAHRPFCDQEAQAVRDFLTFLQTTVEPFSRQTLVGHITASAWILDAAHQRTLLIRHKTLERWLQPGGHIEKSDATPFEAARREAIEETGVCLEPSSGEDIFDVDVHLIPAKGDEPEHWHYDLRYRFECRDDSLDRALAEEESAWHALSELPLITSDPALLRLACKSVEHGKVLTTKGIAI
ncbi:NUDIX domain-containing protein [Agrobacterium vitis]|uniref:NUDIX hydrolase n=1 Tax=Agrobacterium vitis TaxID=373 RepID=UPI0012E84458|nr:NUDIX hydrolase [Agrobacterium vitis]MVA19403.1 NUDIX domain-containing protein [Agrobacterium vitis]